MGTPIVKDSVYYSRWAETLELWASVATGENKAMILRSAQTYALMARLLALDEAIARVHGTEDDLDGERAVYTRSDA